VVTDPLVAVVGGPIVLAPSQVDSSTFTATYTITQTDIDIQDDILNTATVSGLAPNGTVVNDLSSEVVTPLVICTFYGAILEVVTPLVPVCLVVGDMINYNVYIKNTGNLTKTNIDMEDAILGGGVIDFVSSTGSPIPMLAPGDEDITTFTGFHVVTQVDIDNGFVEVQGRTTSVDLNGDSQFDLTHYDSYFLDAPTEAVFNEDCFPFIALIKTGTTADTNQNGCEGDAGDVITYSFTVENTGVVELTNINITDPLPGIVLSGGPIALLLPGEVDNTTFTGTYVITAADQVVGDVTNQATAFGTGPNGLIASDLSDHTSIMGENPTVITTCLIDASISLLKTGVVNNQNGSPSTDEGDTVTYLFTLENTGSLDLYNISIDDTDFGMIIGNDPTLPISPGISISSSPISGDDNGDAILQVTEIWTYEGTYTLTSLDGPFENTTGDGFLRRVLINQATASGEYESGNPSTAVTDLSDDPNNLDDIDTNGDGDPDDPTIVILEDPILSGVFEIFNGITPEDGDGLNDFFRVKGISNWPVNNVKIYNRWGVLVFERDNYGGTNDEENVFAGRSEGRITIEQDRLLPTGTYYYIINFPEDNPGKKAYAGYLFINR
tara:strand:- start:13034 stop:14863 length:1830 start_codon:yes stop_codon:yes gene_type:complete